MGMHVIMTGNPVEGFTVIGPFKTREDAAEWASENIDDDWWAVPLEASETWNDV